MFFHNFHFLRPFCLFIFIPAIIFLYFYYKYQASSNWQKVIDSHLLKALQFNLQEKPKKYFVSLCCFLFFSIIALSGPTYQKLPSSEGFSKSPIIIVLELSSSMLANDISPNRLTRAKFEIEDILKNNPQTSIGLVVFAEDAHIVTPITYDHETILTLLKDLSPNIMPKEGSNIDEGLKKAQEISSNFIAKTLVITANTNNLSLQNYNLDILLWLFNTNISHSDFLSYNDNTSQNKINSWIKNNSILNHKIDINYDDWQDLGPYFIALSLIPFLLFNFKTNLLMCLILMFSYSSKASISDWFLRPEQKSYNMLKNNQFDDVIKNSPNSLQKGYAYYKSNNFEKAAEEFKKDDSIKAKYNLGNTYAQMNKLQEAIDVYKQVLAKDPQHKDALHNKEILEKELEKQKSQEQEQKQQEDKQQEQKSKQQEQKSQEQEQKQQKDKLHEQDSKHQEQKSQEQEQKQQKDNNSTKYYFDKIQENNINYLKQKFMYETRSKK